MKALVFYISFFLFALAKAAPEAESYLDLIEKAQNLILQKDRQQAINVLLAGLKQDPKNKVATIELKKKVEELGSLFLSDKAQQLYETSLSFKRKDLQQALQKINDALRVEPDNVQIMTESARLLIVKGDCNAALDQILKTYKKNTYDEQIVLTMAQVHLCLAAMDQYFSIRANEDPKKITENIDWMNLEIQRFIFEKDKVKAKDLFVRLQKRDSKNPQLLYWQWKISKLEGKEDASLIEKYKLTCNNVSARIFRTYQRDPYFCNKQIEMETESAKK